MNSKTVPDIILHNGRITALDPKNPEATNLEGYLYPDTYDFPPNTMPKAVIDMMVKRFFMVWTCFAVRHESESAPLQRSTAGSKWQFRGSVIRLSLRPSSESQAASAASWIAANFEGGIKLSASLNVTSATQRCAVYSAVKFAAGAPAKIPL